MHWKTSVTLASNILKAIAKQNLEKIRNSHREWFCEKYLQESLSFNKVETTALTKTNSFTVFWKDFSYIFISFHYITFVNTFP